MTLVACTRTGTLTINSVSMHVNGAWTITDLHELWLPNAERAGNVIIPGATGQRAYPWRTDASEYLLIMGIAGERNVSGVPYADQIVGLMTNVEYLRANVLVPPTAPTATYSATLTLPGGGTPRTANVQPIHLDIGKRIGPNISAILTLVVPAGRFA